MRNIELEAICYRADLKVSPYGEWGGVIPYAVWAQLTDEERARVGPLVSAKARRVLYNSTVRARYLSRGASSDST